ncbi:MAG: tetratricopeptide repeat protein [Terracidiphilus sp.]
MTLNYLGYMWADKGIKLPDALKMIRKAVDLEPRTAHISIRWAGFYFKIGEYELAEDNLRQAVNRDQSDPTVHMHLGDLMRKLAESGWPRRSGSFRSITSPSHPLPTSSPET